MSLGTSIFLSATLLALVLLYGFTKDRWRWKWIALVAGFGIGGLLVFVFAVLPAWWTWSDERATREQVEQGRREHAVEIGDHMHRVLQRQGVPDTIVRDSTGITLTYQDARATTTSGRGARRSFIFHPTDSTLRLMSFEGEPPASAVHWWKPRDGIEYGTTIEDLEATLGSPCLEEITETWTVQGFPDREAPDVLRMLIIPHGESTVSVHAWRDGRCPEESETPRGSP